MNKKILILTTVAILVLLIPSMITISPVKAKATKFPFPPATGGATLVESGKVWIAGDIFHMTGSYWEADVEGDMGDADYQQWSHLSINLKTGKGTIQASSLTTFLETPFAGSTLEGSSSSKITNVILEGTLSEGILTYTTTGTFVGHGSGVFEGWVQKGTSDGTAEIILGETVTGSAEWTASGIFLIPPPFWLPFP